MQLQHQPGQRKEKTTREWLLFLDHPTKKNPTLWGSGEGFTEGHRDGHIVLQQMTSVTWRARAGRGTEQRLAEGLLAVTRTKPSERLPSSRHALAVAATKGSSPSAPPAWDVCPQTWSQPHGASCVCSHPRVASSQTPPKATLSRENPPLSGPSWHLWSRWGPCCMASTCPPVLLEPWVHRKRLEGWGEWGSSGQVQGRPQGEGISVDTRAPEPAPLWAG